VKYTTLSLFCLLLLLPVTAMADSLTITPSSFFQFDIEQSATLTGVNLFGDILGAPDETNIFSTTHLQIDGPTGTFTQSINGGFRDSENVDTIYMSIFDSTLAVTGTYNVTVIATDDTGVRVIGPVSYTVVARPVVPQNPLIFVPELVFAQATSANGATVQFSVTGTSFVDPPPAPTITCDHSSGAQFPLGGTTVNCTATDSFGSASGSFPVFVMDVVGPVVTVPSDMVVPTQRDSGGNPIDTTVTFTASAVDAIAGTVPVDCFPASGSVFPIGTTLVTCVALDEQDNPGFGQFNVTVSTGPVLTLPPNLTVECTSPAGTPVSFTPTATDNATIVCNPASGSTFPLGTTTDNCTATATTGTASGSFNVTVVDTTPPSISSVTATPNTLWPPDKTMRAVTIGVSIVDVCSSNPAGGCQIISVSSNEPDGTTQWQITGPLTLNLKADRFGSHVPGTAPGSGGRVYTITVRCTDGSGNASTQTVTVTVPHDQGS
jgi:HYR domain